MMGKSIRVNVSLPCPCCGSTEILVKSSSEIERKITSVAVLNLLKFSATVYCKRCGSYSVSDPSACHSKREAIHSACNAWDQTMGIARTGVYAPNNAIPIANPNPEKSDTDTKGSKILFLPCPFCGSESIDMISASYDGKSELWTGIVGCTECGGCIKVSSPPSVSAADAVELARAAWNRRV